MKMIEGKQKIHGRKIGIVISRFNDFITKNLLAGCLAQLKRSGIKESEITVVWVPGAFEIPVVALRLARKKSIDAVICLGAVIRGETLHFELIARAAAQGIEDVSLLTGKPTIFGVLTTETVDQAYKRSQIKGNNKGVDAALAAVETIAALENL